MKTTIKEIKRAIRSVLIEAGQQKATVWQPSYFEDGPRSFWRVRIGVSPQQNATKLGQVVRSFEQIGYHVFDKQFSSPQKKFGGLRINSVSSEYDPDQNVRIGNAMHGDIINALKQAGFEVVSQ